MVINSIKILITERSCIDLVTYFFKEINNHKNLEFYKQNKLNFNIDWYIFNLNSDPVMKKNTINILQFYKKSTQKTLKEFKKLNFGNDHEIFKLTLLHKTKSMQFET